MTDGRMKTTDTRRGQTWKKKRHRQEKQSAKDARPKLLVRGFVHKAQQLVSLAA